MKKLMFLLLLIPFFGVAQFKIVNTSTTNILELRPGPWPITLQRVTKESNTSFVLIFRNQEYNNEVIMKTLPFHDLEQLKYFQKGLSTLKTGTNGDVAEFKDYTIKRVDVKIDAKKGDVWYTLTCGDGGSTNFLQSDADKMITAINAL
jgi:hypothetical protein